MEKHSYKCQCLECLNERAEALDVDGITAADLAYLDEQAEQMAIQYNLPSGGMMEPAKDVDIVWSEAVTFVSNAEEQPHKQYRLVMFIAGHDVEGPWSDYQAAVFKVECLRLARAGVGFSVEFH